MLIFFWKNFQAPSCPGRCLRAISTQPLFFFFKSLTSSTLSFEYTYTFPAFPPMLSIFEILKQFILKNASKLPNMEIIRTFFTIVSLLTINIFVLGSIFPDVSRWILTFIAAAQFFILQIPFCYFSNPNLYYYGWFFLPTPLILILIGIFTGISTVRYEALKQWKSTSLCYSESFDTHIDLFPLNLKIEWRGTITLGSLSRGTQFEGKWVKMDV